jgi:hypothetical protein
MHTDPIVNQILRQVEKSGVGIKLQTTPILEQQPELIGEDWVIHYISGNADYEFLAHRTFKQVIASKLPYPTNVLSYRMDNLQAANNMVQQLLDALPPESTQGIQPGHIPQEQFGPDDPVYVVIVVRQRFAYH